MPMSSGDLGKCKQIIAAVVHRDDVDDFKTRANASDAAWWEADFNQRKELKQLAIAKPWTGQPATKIGDVAEWVAQYCTLVSTNAASPWINNNLSADGANRAHWLRYFFAECYALLPPPPAAVTTINRLLVKPPVGDLALKHGTINGIDNDTFRGLLTSLLNAGFEKMPGTETHYNTQDTSDIHLMAFFRMNKVSEKFNYCWRSDARPYRKIEEDEGFLAKGRTKKWAEEHGMRQPWHPFSNPAVRSHQWFRKGQVDNCLYSVVSIGTGDWPTYIPFPLLADHKAWAVDDVEMRCKIDGNFGKITLGVSSTWLYLFVMSDMLLADTEGIVKYFNGHPYPEVGVPGIPLENIFGGIRFIRVHHAPKATADDKMGCTAFPVSIELTDKNRFTIKERWGEGYSKLRTAFYDVYKSEQLSGHWTPTGFAKTPNIFDVGGKKVELLTGTFLDLAKKKYGAEK